MDRDKEKSIFKRDLFIQYIKGINERIESLYHRSSKASSTQQNSELLPIAFKELGTASEELLVALENLEEQQQQLAESRVQLEAERTRYQSLFEAAPHAYIILDRNGVIVSANRAAARLFDCHPGVLNHKPFSILIPLPARLEFREELKKRQQMKEEPPWPVRLFSPHREPFEALLTCAVERDSWGGVLSTCLCIQEISDRPGSDSGQNLTKQDLFSDRPRHQFCKGEQIPLESDAMWLICQGWVKLSTFTDSNTEIIMGIAGQNIPFCRTLTGLPIYQVTALSQTVELVSISHLEIAHSSHLAGLIAEGVKQRLQQTELFLSVCGRRRAIDRLLTLIRVLKTILGEPVAMGTRLSLRLTHQELADTCCTTRATITRLLSELQHQGIIKIDSLNHITICESGNSRH